MRDDTLITKIEQMKEIKQAMGLPIAGSLLFAKSPVSPSFRTPFRERFQPRHKSLGHAVRPSNSSKGTGSDGKGLTAKLCVESSSR
jgi:hypothetical protein